MGMFICVGVLTNINNVVWMGGRDLVNRWRDVLSMPRVCVWNVRVYTLDCGHTEFLLFIVFFSEYSINECLSVKQLIELDYGKTHSWLFEQVEVLEENRVNWMKKIQVTRSALKINVYFISLFVFL